MSDENPRRKGPIIFEVDPEKQGTVTPSTADPVPEIVDGFSGSKPAAMQRAAGFIARKPSKLFKWFWRLFAALFSFVLSLTAYDFVMGLISRSPILGGIAMVLLVGFLIILLAISLQELAAFARLKRVDVLNKLARVALEADDLHGARDVAAKLRKVYRGRDDVAWGLARFDERAGEVFDADGILGLAEHTILSPLDAAATKEVEAAARQVATVTALVPIALADVFTALTANLRMIRRIGEIYGGRSGTLGSWRVTRAVMTHLVATGAVAVGDDLIGSLAGGGVLAKISRRFGEGVVNGALTARVGVAAIEVCRPLPFVAVKKPSVTGVIKRSLTGLFDRG